MKLISVFFIEKKHTLSYGDYLEIVGIASRPALLGP
jgi:hypothetical protein